MPLLEVEYEEKDIADIARQMVSLVSSLPATKGSLLLLEGELGAGKTKLTQAMGEQLGITEGITSPTFVLLRHYQCEHPRFTDVFHLDLYRIETEDEVAMLRLPEVLENPAHLVVVEWPERIPRTLSGISALQGKIAITGETTRRVSITQV